MNVAIIGAGHIAAALVQGWRRPSVTEPPALIVFDVATERAEHLAAAGGGRAATSAAAAVTGADLTVVAVRPEDVESVLADLAPVVGGPIVSVAAGVSVERLVAALPAGAGVCRVMPNVAAAMGLGVFLFVRGTLSGPQAELVVRLFSAAGTVFALEEERFDAATAVAGCMPGMLASLVTYFAAAAEAHGIEPAAARLLAVEGVHGAAALIAAGGDPAAVTAAAATPGGMTAAAVASLEADGVADAIEHAVTAAAERAKELA